MRPADGPIPSDLIQILAKQGTFRCIKKDPVCGTWVIQVASDAKGISQNIFFTHYGHHFLDGTSF